MSFLDIFSKNKKDSHRIERPLSESSFREMLYFAEERELHPRLPDLTGKKVLEISPNQKTFLKELQHKGAQAMARLGTSQDKGREPGNSQVPFILAHWENLPFLKESLDFVLLRTSFLKTGLSRLVHESGRIVKPKGMVLVSDRHPFSQMVQGEHFKNPAGEEGIGPGFERYLKIFQESGLRLTWVKELFFDGSLKKFFASKTEQENFNHLRKTPFLISFLLSKE